MTCQEQPKEKELERLVAVLNILKLKKENKRKS